MANIFVSYAHDDADFVIPIVDVIKKKGHNAELDKEFLSGGDRLVPAIKQKIEKSDFVIVFLSSSSVKSIWVAREIFEALRSELETGKGKIVPCIINKIRHSVFPEVFVKHPSYERVYIDFTNNDKTKQDSIDDLHKRLDKEQISEFAGDDYMILNIGERGLEIYLTGNDVEWEKNSQRRYAEMLESYLLFGFRKDALGPHFKHFVVCDKADIKGQKKIKDILKSTNYAVTGDGNDDDEAGKWRIWFLRRDYDTTRGYDHPYSNNVW